MMDNTMIMMVMTMMVVMVMMTVFCRLKSNHISGLGEGARPRSRRAV